MLSRFMGFLSPYLLPIAGAAILGLSVLTYMQHLSAKAHKAELAAKETAMSALTAENGEYSRLVTKLAAEHAAQLEAVKNTQVKVIERVRVVERAKQEVINVAQGDIGACAPGVSAVLERVREYEAERRLQAGGDRTKAAP